jgi:tRNA dimethylallyltransferase
LYNVDDQFSVSAAAVCGRQPLLVAVAGPTASAKSDLALRIAAEFRGEIVSCDSVQVYRGFDIGSAKLSEAEQLGIPHHLIDLRDPAEVFTAGEFAREARRAIAGIARRGRMPVLAGGTGFYLRSLIHGLSPGPERHAGLRERLEARESRHPGFLQRLLRRLDPVTARRIHGNDVRKMVRAIEICMLSRRPASAAPAREALAGYRVLKIGLFPPRAELYERIQLRAERMFREGLAEEVEGLLKKGVPADVKPFQSLNYRQALQVARGEMTVEQAIFDMALGTRHFAKRQMTWFRREPGLVVFEGFGDDEKIIQAVMERVRAEA